MYIAGITQSLMWRDFTPEGVLRYGNFLETVLRIVPMYALRAAGGTLFLTGAAVAVYNLYRTARMGALIRDEAAEAPPPDVGGRRVGSYFTLSQSSCVSSVVILRRSRTRSGRRISGCALRPPCRIARSS